MIGQEARSFLLVLHIYIQVSIRTVSRQLNRIVVKVLFSVVNISGSYQSHKFLNHSWTHRMSEKMLTREWRKGDKIFPKMHREQLSFGFILSRSRAAVESIPTQHQPFTQLFNHLSQGNAALATLSSNSPSFVSVKNCFTLRGNKISFFLSQNYRITKHLECINRQGRTE